jgi:hypothetical protein
MLREIRAGEAGIQAIRGWHTECIDPSQYYEINHDHLSGIPNAPGGSEKAFNRVGRLLLYGSKIAHGTIPDFGTTEGNQQ